MSKLRRILAEEGFGKTALKIDPRKVDAINEMTDYNDHTGAAIAYAELVGDRKTAKVLNHVADIHKIMGYMPHDLGQFRSALMKPVYAIAKKIAMPDGGSLYDHLH
jgi:hypothetical protein